MVNQKTTVQIGKFFPPVKGGMETHLYDLCYSIKGDVQVTVVAANNSLETVHENIDGIEVYRVSNLATINSQPICPSLPGIIKRLDADIIHLHLPNPLLLSMISRYLKKRVYVVTWHCDIIRQKYLKILFHNNTINTLRRARAIIVPTEFHVSNSRYLPLNSHASSVSATYWAKPGSSRSLLERLTETGI